MRFLVPVFLVLWGCSPPSTKNQSVNYNIDSLLEAQAAYLSGHHAILHKKSVVMNSSDSVSTQPDSATWIKELDPFRILDAINKPSYHDLYSRQNLKDTSSNLSILSIHSDEDVSVRFLNIFYSETPSDMKRIESLFLNSKLFFKDQQRIVLKFEDFSGTPVLTGYSLSGSQKVMFGAPSNFEIRSNITFP